MADRQVIVGTAGHIDHGKTSLTRRLTGIDTDRLPEEKRRGITIDLGFAHFERAGVRFGVVDVPGHERFVHNMVAGAAGIDLALLVIAADDQIMPQTREHLDILRLLGVRAGVVALTKADLVDELWLELARDEIAALTAGSFLEGAPIVPVDNLTGRGVEEVADALLRAAAGLIERPAAGPARLPLDRVFSLPGHGTIVAGTLLSGAIAVGDEMEILPHGNLARVRRLQAHGAELDVARPGQRVAVNLAGTRAEELRRGDELATPGSLRPTRRLLVAWEALPGHALGHRREYRLHLGPREATARLVLPSVESQLGRFAELRTNEPMLATRGQRFLLRRLSPATTVGGGMVVDPLVDVESRFRDMIADAPLLAQDNPAARLSAHLRRRDGIDAISASQRLAIAPDELPALRNSLAAAGGIQRVGQSWIHAERRLELRAALIKKLDRLLAARAPLRTVDRSALLSACRRLAAPPVLSDMLDDLAATGVIWFRGGGVALAGRAATLSRALRLRMGAVAAIQAGGSAPPMIGEVAESTGATAKELDAVAAVAAEDGMIFRVGDGYYCDPVRLDELAESALALLRVRAATLAELRDAWRVTRKHAVPLAECFDKLGITKRQGDLRTAGPKAESRPWRT